MAIAYDVFISYSRADNSAGWVDGIRDFLVDDHRRFSQDDLTIYMDTRENRVGDHWREKLRLALTGSRVLLVCLSPSYFASDLCRWEWEVFAASRSRVPGSANSVAGVFFVEVDDPDPEDVDEWKRQAREVHHAKVEPWFPRGRDAFAEEAVRLELAALSDLVWEQSRWASMAPEGNLVRFNENFVGRSAEITQLRDRLVGVSDEDLGPRVSVVTAVHGLGGQGKTELATSYAHQFRRHYQGGTWTVPCEGLSSMNGALARLATEPTLTVETSDEPPEDVLVRRVIAALRARADAVESSEFGYCLLMLDNVDDPDLLSAANTHLVASVPWLHVLATTRLSEEELKANRRDLAFLALDGLDVGESHELLRTYQHGGAFASTELDDQARVLAAHLSGFTLAVEQAAIYLRDNPEDSPADLLAAIERGSSIELDSARAGTRHDGTLEAILEQTWSRLPKRAREALLCASLLPPDTIMWSWLEALTDDQSGDRWSRTQRLIQSRRLLTEGDDLRLGRMHRLLHAAVRRTDDRAVARSAEVARHLARQADTFDRQPDQAQVTAKAVVAASRSYLDDRTVQVALGNSSERLSHYLTAEAVLPLTRAVLGSMRELSEAHPGHLEARRDLSVSLNQVGGLLVPVDAGAARVLFEESLQIARELSEAQPGHLQARRDVVVVLFKIAELMSSSNDDARRHEAWAAVCREFEVISAAAELTEADAQAFAHARRRRDGAE